MFHLFHLRKAAKFGSLQINIIKVINLHYKIGVVTRGCFFVIHCLQCFVEQIDFYMHVTSASLQLHGIERNPKTQRKGVEL